MNDSNRNKAAEHIIELFVQAKSVFDHDPDLSKRYVVLARKTAMKHKIRLSKDQKLSFCKQCNAFLRRGANSTIRIHDNRVVLSCKECGFVRRFVLK